MCVCETGRVSPGIDFLLQLCSLTAQSCLRVINRDTQAKTDTRQLAVWSRQHFEDRFTSVSTLVDTHKCLEYSLHTNIVHNN